MLVFVANVKNDSFFNKLKKKMLVFFLSNVKKRTPFLHFKTPDLFRVQALSN